LLLHLDTCLVFKDPLPSATLLSGAPSGLAPPLVRGDKR